MMRFAFTLLPLIALPFAARSIWKDYKNQTITDSWGNTICKRSDCNLLFWLSLGFETAVLFALPVLAFLMWRIMPD